MDDVSTRCRQHFARPWLALALSSTPFTRRGLLFTSALYINAPPAPSHLESGRQCSHHDEQARRRAPARFVVSRRWPLQALMCPDIALVGYKLSGGHDCGTIIYPQTSKETPRRLQSTSFRKSFVMLNLGTLFRFYTRSPSTSDTSRIPPDPSPPCKERKSVGPSFIHP